MFHYNVSRYYKQALAHEFRGLKSRRCILMVGPFAIDLYYTHNIVRFTPQTKSHDPRGRYQRVEGPSAWRPTWMTRSLAGYDPRADRAPMNMRPVHEGSSQTGVEK